MALAHTRPSCPMYRSEPSTNAMPNSSERNRCSKKADPYLLSVSMTHVGDSVSQSEANISRYASRMSYGWMSYPAASSGMTRRPISVHFIWYVMPDGMRRLSSSITYRPLPMCTRSIP